MPFVVGEEEQSGEGQLAQMTVGVSNFQGMALRFAKDNDLSLNDVTIRLINTTLTVSGQDDNVKLQILSAVYTNEVAKFELGFNFNYDVDGPRQTWNRRDFPSIPFNVGKFFTF